MDIVRDGEQVGIQVRANERGDCQEGRARRAKAGLVPHHGTSAQLSLTQKPKWSPPKKRQTVEACGQTTAIETHDGPSPLSRGPPFMPLTGHLNWAAGRDPPDTRHSITLSARASSNGGTVRPSALAVLRLIVRSNLVG